MPPATTDSFTWDPQLAADALERAAHLPMGDRLGLLEDDSLDPGTRHFVAGVLASQQAHDIPAIRAGYRLLARLGEGGFGEVYLGRSTRSPKRLAAVKVLRHGLAGARIIRRFESEQQALARLNYPAIAGIFESGTTDDDRPFFAMPFVMGEPITTYARRRELDLRARVALFRTLLDAIAHAHRRGVLHRDLKPANILVGDGERGPGLAVIDFGIAKSLDQPLSEHSFFTEAGAFVGTPGYMSPEQADGLPEAADVRSDIYALGVILYELLCGELPIDRETLRRGGTSRIGETIRTTSVAPPSRRCRLAGRDAHARRVSGDLDAICMRALARNPADRYTGAGAMLEDIDRVLAGEPVLTRPWSWRDTLGTTVRRHRTAFAVAASTSLALAIGLSFTGRFAVLAGRESETRRVEAERAAMLADFLAGIFTGLDPVQANGRDTTLLRTLLDDASEQLRKDAPGLQPDVALQLHVVLGTAYLKLIVIDQARSHLDAARTAALDAGMDIDESLRIDALSGWLKLSSFPSSGLSTPEIVDTANRLLDRYGWLSDPEARMPVEIVDGMSALALAAGGYTIDSDGVRPCEPHGRCRTVMLEQLLAFAESRFGANSESAIGIRTNLGRAYQLEGDYDTAYRLLLETLRDAEFVLGRRHPLTLNTVVVLQICAEQIPDAIADHGSWLPDFEAVFPESHPRLASMRHNHAWFLHRAGRTPEAIPLFEAAYVAAQENLGELNDMTVWYLHGLLDALGAVGDSAASERRIVELFEAYADASTSDAATRTDLPQPEVLHNLANWFERWQERPPAVPARVLAMFQRLPVGAPSTAESPIGATD